MKRREKGMQEGYLPMTWLEEHMLKNDAFPASMHASPTCYVINSAVYFRDGLPDAKALEELLENRVDIKDHLLRYDPVADSQALDDKINEVLPRLVWVKWARSISENRVSEIISIPLDLNKPLWEVHMVPVRRGSDCIIFRTHHSMADGLSLVTAYQSLATDANGMPAKVVPGKAAPPQTKMTFTRFILMAVDSVRSALHILYTVFQPLESSFSFNTPIEHRAGDMRWSGSRRAVLFKPFSLEYVRAITKKTPKKTTINDVLLSATVGAIKAYSGNTVDSTTTMRTLLALGFPANLPNRPPTDRLTNSFSINACDLAKAMRASDPVSRVLATSRAMGRLKRSMEAVVEFWLMNVLFPLLPVQIYEHIAKKYFAKHTMLFSNVPGPKNGLFLAGKEVTGVQGIFLDAIPEVYYNITLDPEVVKDWDKFEQLFREELLSLGRAVGIADDDL
ncbi:hypothetical protein FOL47_007384 [Perkinsus chesapeaki]|uniref:Diacylglycerol O-acyltransferase n=1 Tax=Perkinsus chesapeaki TaxID=330153 RepID=A0A7J6LLJ1_PERCH|nr:hypothetical protein FOL47_007384 [Perkinsus chesapeaki]